MKKFKNKYRIASARLQNWDYGTDGAYFITICTDKREHFFGEIVMSKMELNQLGEIAHNIWAQIPDQFPYVELGNFVIMPNHTHGILIINKLQTMPGNSIEAPFLTPQSQSKVTNSENENIGGICGDKNPMLQENISRIIRWYKGRCSFEMRKINPDFNWQTRFHDHVIRNSRAFDTIQNYIEANPLKWKEDKFHL